MFWFKKMVDSLPELLNKNRLVNLIHDGTTIHKNKFDVDSFYNCASKCRSFVRSYRLEEAEEVNISIEEHSDVDLPFTTCSFEVSNGGFTVESGTNIRCLLASEESPRVYKIYSFEEYGNNLFGITSMTDTAGSGFKSSFTKLIKEQFLDPLQSGQLIAENIKEHVKIGCGQNRKIHTIRQIIHIQSKKYQSVKPICGGTIDYSHRFEVRGHWRRISGLGKDRDGQYCVRGMTWVVPFEKGPENLPLIKKVRVMNG